MPTRAPRRFLPSLPLLAAFEAAARTGSITRAATELALTQSAVSRQIKTLEGQLGIELFIREKQKIRLTSGGQTYAREIRGALQKISNASLNLRANPGGGTLTLAVPPTFGARWLAPRLPDFTRRHPDVVLNMLNRLTKFDFKQDVIDAAIYFGPPHWPDAEMLMLKQETMIPVCSPEFAARYEFRKASDLRRAPLLHLTSRPDAWERWMRAHDVDDRAVHGMLFDQFSNLAAAAAAGMGIALVPDFLFESELASGAMVPALPLLFTSAEAYYLCWPRECAAQAGLVSFRDWLVEEMGGCRSG